MDSRLRKLIKDKNIRIETVPEAFLSLVEKAQGSIFDNILEIISRLEVKAGRIAQSRANLLLLDQITAELLKTPEYGSAIRSFVTDFDLQAQLNNQYFSLVDKSFAPSEFTKALLEVSKRNTIELLSGASVQKDFINPVKSLVEQAISSGGSLKDTIKSIREVALGTDSKLMRYSRQVSYDAFAMYDRGYSKAAGEDLGLEWYLWSGGLKDTSRPLCKANNEQYFHRKEIEMFGEGLDLDGKPLSKEKLQGRIRGTNKDNIFQVAGGHLCQHSLMPVSIAAVPKEVVLRNIEAGRYKPDKADKKFFNL